MTSKVVLAGKSLEHGYRLGSTQVAALRGVDVAIGPGEFVVLAGPSGSGKTTLINLLGLLDRPTRGSVLLDGAPLERLDEDARADLRRDRYGFVFQNFNLVPVVSAIENVEYPLRLRGVAAAARRRRAEALLERVGIAHKAGVRPDLLSGGERQRVAVARALANEPEVILADEPTANLDTQTADGVLDALQAAAADRAAAIVLATHDPRVMARAHRVVRLVDGRLAEPA
jgi:putative ABC transport system ATP-binding protein